MGSASNEAWRPVVGYEGVYAVSDHGRVARVAAGQGARPGIRRQSTHPNGYRQVALSKGNRVTTKKVHRLVLEAFVGPCPDGLEGCHEDDNPSNNHLANLRWDTHQANCEERSANGKTPKSSPVSETCKSGEHRMTPENTKYEKNGWRICLACRAAKNARRRIQKKETN